MYEELILGNAYFVTNLPKSSKQKIKKGMFYLLQKGHEGNLNSLPRNITLDVILESNKEIPEDSLYLFSYRRGVSIEYKQTFNLESENKSRYGNRRKSN
jgi:hypothetical protein